MKEDKNEELQSRRSFFKNAAKAALPILGTIALAHMPIVSQAREHPTDCSKGCYTGCYNTIKGGCGGGCGSTCSGRCIGSCKATCMDSCYKGGR